MKSSIIYLGIALVTFSNVILASDQQSDRLAQFVQANENSEGNTPAIYASETKTIKGGNPERFEPETIEVPVYEKTMAEIIAENNLITESNLLLEQPVSENNSAYEAVNLTIDFYPISIEKTMEEIILEGNQIIENPMANTVSLATLEKPKKS